jgi:hypothetical protein
LTAMGEQRWMDLQYCDEEPQNNGDDKHDHLSAMC